LLTNRQKAVSSEESIMSEEIQMYEEELIEILREIENGIEALPRANGNARAEVSSRCALCQSA